MTDLADQLRRERERNRRLARRASDLEAENRELRRRLEDVTTVHGLSVITEPYWSTLATLAHIAHHGWRRPDDLGTITHHAPGSMVPRYNTAAYRILRNEHKDQARRAHAIRKQASTLVDREGTSREQYDLRIVDRQKAS